MRRIHYTASAIVGGILSSFLFLAVGGRIAVYVLSLVTHQPVSFSIEGTIATLVFSTSIGVVGGALFSMVGRLLPGSHAAKGGYFGLLLFIVLMPMFPPSIQTDILGLGQYIPLAITLFGLLLMGFGSTLAFLACTLTPPNAIRNAEVVVQQSSHYQQTIRSAS
jgi:hypothetical protein